MPKHECPHCGEGFRQSCPYLWQPELLPSDRPCLDFWDKASGYDPDRKHDEQRDEPSTMGPDCD